MSPRVPAVKAIVFDFGNVICAFDNSIFLRGLLPYTGKSFGDLEELIYRSDLPVRYETGLITSEEFFGKVSERCNLSISRERFIDAFTGIFTPLPGTFRLIRELKERYRVGLLSNTNEWHYEYFFKTIDIFPWFDSVTLSYKVKEMKPGPRIYRDALEKLKVEPKECVYIDDIEAYAEAASGLGMRGIRYVSDASLRESLGAFGVRA